MLILNKSSPIVIKLTSSRFDNLLCQLAFLTFLSSFVLLLLGDKYELLLLSQRLSLVVLKRSELDGSNIGVFHTFLSPC